MEMKISSPGFPSYYEDINAVILVIKNLAFGILIALTISIIIKKVQKKKLAKKEILISAILFIIVVIASFIKMPYWT